MAGGLKLLVVRYLLFVKSNGVGRRSYWTEEEVISYSLFVICEKREKELIVIGYSLFVIWEKKEKELFVIGY